MNEKNTMKSSQVKKSALNVIDVMLVVLIVLPLGLLIAFQVVSRSNEVTTVRLEYSLDVYGVSENVDTSKLASDILYTADDCTSVSVYYSVFDSYIFKHIVMECTADNNS